jgi:cytochrome c nitrite reductase small subunit
MRQIRRAVNALLGLGFVFLVPMLGAADAQPNFQVDPVEVWGQRFLIAVIAIGTVLLLFSLVRYRGRTPGLVAWVTVLLAAVVVPLVSTGFGTVLMFEKAEKVEFCESCHLTMQSFVDDMHNPNSISLAALHYKNRYIPDNQCYTCHTSYGIFGTVEAKASGMVDVYKYYTRTFHLPVAMRSPYPNHDCLKCHADSAKWRDAAGGVHTAIQDQLFSDQLKCLDCHGSDHPAHTLAAQAASN